ncbi:methionyl-tRNA formyltransferase, mitochondrial isoform X2 [Micropterus salmoides]|uniref:methionyl-tRNA formyltransferase, mitochondrial isoform X2 n=1 Tax=Micropterus salmoides TaxID=27706 RepID=UPI0018ED7580|nr:methionyl-tRNA formyltransferase, mitochondrial isoform X2 [Micropterus salmoides]
MWTSGKTAAASLNLLHRFQRCCVRTGWRTRNDGRQRRLMSSAGPPWRLLFFGSDHFAVESLKLLTSSRSSRDGVVESLEVVTLSGEVPVKRFAQQNHLPVHSWPPDNVDGRFDVGVVVSFGCLLPERLINKFPHGILNVHPSLLPRWRGPAPVFHTIIHGDTVTGVTIMQIRPHRFDVGPILNQEFHQVHENCTAEELGAALATKGAHLVPLRTTWMGRTIKLLDFVGKCNISLCDPRRNPVPGSVHYQKESDTLAVCCKDGWVGFKTVVLKKRLTAADFYNGYLHQTSGGVFVSRKGGSEAHQKSQKSML